MFPWDHWLQITTRNKLIWHTDGANQQEVDELNDRGIAIVRGPDRSEYANVQNGTRTAQVSSYASGEKRTSIDSIY
ncbi:hypothetical protein GGR56DRAFT_617440 [Xylariaceae sp. FL0804]|nr:hypothetical protein GGR56DRAFT_617440 [Xylariaceae sp. FL0804]